MNTKVLITASSILLLGLASCATNVEKNETTENTATEGSVEKETAAASFDWAPFAYRAYNGQDLSNIGTETVLFFFQASCGTCQKTHTDLISQSELPDGVNVINVDFDTATELNEKYDVTTKHTFVLIDANGNMLAKEIGLASTQDIVTFVTENSASNSEKVMDNSQETEIIDNESTEQEAEASVEAQEDPIVESETETAQVIEETVEIPVVASGIYKDYNGSIEKESVLFFHASWCPSCVAADKGFSAESELAINADIIKVDYDSESELKKKYGVTSQHTFVLVDADGNMIKKMVSGTKSSDLTDLFN